MIDTVVAEDPIRVAEQLISAAGKRVTDKRRKLLALMLGETRPISAYEITDRFNQRYDEHIVANSIYRILDWLSKSNLVHKLTTINKYVACQHKQCQQHSSFSLFMICQHCQKTEEHFVSPQMFEEITTGASTKGFPTLLPHIELTGVCSECSAAERIEEKA